MKPRYSSSRRLLCVFFDYWRKYLPGYSSLEKHNRMMNVIAQASITKKLLRNYKIALQNCIIDSRIIQELKWRSAILLATESLNTGTGTKRVKRSSAAQQGQIFTFMIWEFTTNKLIIITNISYLLALHGRRYEKQYRQIFHENLHIDESNQHLWHEIQNFNELLLLLQCTSSFILRDSSMSFSFDTLDFHNFYSAWYLSTTHLSLLPISLH